MSPLGFAVARLFTESICCGSGIVTARIGRVHYLTARIGSENTRKSITHGMFAIVEHPDQWDLYQRKRPVAEGQRVVMSHRSANFDEDVFDDPFSFNIVAPVLESAAARPAVTRQMASGLRDEGLRPAQ